jgi:N-terminal acetyltransferase B complex non-catalytic subunit
MVIILAALALYISILEQQAKYDAALEILSGDLGSLMGREEDKLRTQVISISIFFDSVLFFK